MRYYKIDITAPPTTDANGKVVDGKSVLPSSLGGLPLSSLLPNGSFNPGALNIELDIPVAPQGVPIGNAQALCRIHNLSLRDMSSAYRLAPSIATDANPNPPAGANITIFAGMSKGLPLANAAQQGPLVTGSVYNAYGNWLGTEMTMDLILAASTGAVDRPRNIILNWQPGQSLSDALKATLGVAFPGIPVKIDISPNLITNHQQGAVYNSLAELGEVVAGLSKQIINQPSYQGVFISASGTRITVDDGTVKPTPKLINFNDLIGQPVWTGPGNVQVKLVMRGDLAIQDLITLPKSLVTTTNAASSQFFDHSAFSGNYRIFSIHHYGNFRQADAASWNTTVDLYPELNDNPAQTPPTPDNTPLGGPGGRLGSI